MAIDADIKKTLRVHTSFKEATPRRIVFVPPRCVSRTDSDGLVLPDKYLCRPADVKKEMGWNKPSLRGVGIRNCGNTCYMNSVLQALTHSSALANDAISGRHLSTCPRKSSNTFCGYCALMTHMKSALQTVSNSSISPEPILRHLKLIAKSMRYGRQEDSHEFLRQLIDSCVSGELPLTANKAQQTVSPLVKSTTFMGMLFSGHLQSMVTCQSCGHVSRTFDPFMDISLDIQDCQSIKDCFRKFTKPDILAGQNAYKCSKCQKRVTAQKQMVVQRCPPLLTIQLKRFNMFAKKINKRISIDSNLDIGPFMSTSSSPLTYSLYSVIVHEGSSMGSGHYVCYSKAANGMWYLFNDSDVRQVAEKTVLSENAYILFYQCDQLDDPRVMYPPLGHEECFTPTSPPPLVSIATPVCADQPFGGARVINHDTSDESSSEDSSDESEVSVKESKPFPLPLHVVVGKRDRKILRALTLFKLIRRRDRRKADSDNADVVKALETALTAATPTPTKQPAQWSRVAVSTWDDQVVVPSSKPAPEPGARSEHDLEYDQGKCMHNPRSEFSAGKGLPPSLTDDFNYVAKNGPVGYRSPGKGGFGKGGFRGKGKGKGGFGGKGKGKGGFGKGGFRGKGKGHFRSNRE